LQQLLAVAVARRGLGCGGALRCRERSAPIRRGGRR
jgi:hypothetical protein